MSKWKNPPYHNSEAYSELCNKSAPSDFYFAIQKDSDEFCMIAIVPKDYFHEHGCMWDQSMFLNHILPDDVSESMESVWENDGDRSIEELRQDMLDRGFEENSKLSKLVREDYD